MPCRLRRAGGALIAQLVALAAAVAELRQAQQPRTCVRLSRRRAHKYRGSAASNRSDVPGRETLPNTLVKTFQQV
jgi:hypothetical protein